MIRKREKHNDQIPGRRSGKDLQPSNSSVTNSTLNLRQMFPYANKELSDKTSKIFFFFFTTKQHCYSLQHQAGSQARTKPHAHTWKTWNTFSWVMPRSSTLRSKLCFKKTPKLQTFKLQKLTKPVRLLNYKRLVYFYLHIIKNYQPRSFLQADLLYLSVWPPWLKTIKILRFLNWSLQ